MRRIVLICVAVVMTAITVGIGPAVACPDDPEARSAYPSWRCR